MTNKNTQEPHRSLGEESYEIANLSLVLTVCGTVNHLVKQKLTWLCWVSFFAILWMGWQVEGLNKSNK